MEVVVVMDLDLDLGLGLKCGVVWCGVVWCGVVWCGVVWWRGVVCGDGSPPTICTMSWVVW